MNKFNKAGFTLIELLVVISIIAALMGLLLPAVNGAREAARRMECMNNQKNLSLAILNYETAKKELPPMRRNLQFSALTDASFATDSRINWIVLILPYMEEGALYSRIYEKQNFDSPVLKVLKCSSSTKDFSALSNGSGPTSYVANCGAQNLYSGSESAATMIMDSAKRLYYEPAELDSTDKANGIVGKDIGIFFDHCGGRTSSSVCKTTTNIDFISSADGASKTILLSENEDAGYWILNKRAVDGVGYVIDSGEEYDIGFTLPLNASTLSTYTFSFLTNAAVTGTNPGPARLNVGKGYADTTVGGISFARNTTNAQNIYRLARPSSNHVGVIVVALCDGSIQTMNDNIDDTTYARLLMPKDGTSTSL